MTTRFRLSSNGTQHHHLMIEATPSPENVVPSRGLGRMDGFALSLVLDEGDLNRLRTAVQGPEITMLKLQLADMSNSYEQVKKARDTAKARAADLGAEHGRSIERLRIAQRDHAQRERASATTIGKIATEVSALKQELRTAQREKRTAETELAVQKEQYAKLHDKHRVLSTGYERIVGQNAKFLATTSRPLFSFDPAMSSELDRLRKDLEAARAERDGARADADCSKSAYQQLLDQWGRK